LIASIGSTQVLPPEGIQYQWTGQAPLLTLLECPLTQGGGLLASVSGRDLILCDGKKVFVGELRVLMSFQEEVVHQENIDVSVRQVV
jgi:hypothetical protein